MKKLTAKDIREYLYHNYVKVDGLWFIKIEEQYGFDRALELDREVWRILPKLQARFLKNRLDLDHSMHDLLEALKVKMKFDGFKFKVNINSSRPRSKETEAITKVSEKTKSAPEETLDVKITDCPWHNIMIKSKRENLSEKIGTLICITEYSAFAEEFNKSIKVKIEDRICRGSSQCVFKFLKNL